MFGMKKLKTGFKQTEIMFTDMTQLNLEQPQPASHFIPDWYKNTVSYLSDEKKPTGQGKTGSTIKKCMPVFDAMTAGYIITLPADVWVSIRETNGEKEQYFEWSNFGLIEFHSIEQAPLHPSAKPYAYPKFINPWAVKTPRGYSSLFVQPFHREAVFTIMPGVVDTDKYTAPVNFPMVINDPNFEGLIPVGTPIAQIIPFKRERWVKTIGKQKDVTFVNILKQKLQTKFFDSYKSFFWTKKEYR
jgi:hypothetical protein